MRKELGISWDNVYPDRHALFCTCDACEKARLDRLVHFERSIARGVVAAPSPYHKRIMQRKYDLCEHGTMSLCSDCSGLA